MANELKVLITGDAGSAMEALDRFSKALGGFTTDIAKTALGFGSLAGIAAMATGKIAEGIKGLVNIIPEAIESTNHLAESFKNLQITAGMGLHDFNAFNASIELSGGKAEMLSEIVSGMEKGIKKNADVLIANGIAANAAALSHMTLGEYIRAVVEKMEKLSSATDKDQLLMAAFGRGGMQFASVLGEINKHMAEGQAIADRGGVLDQAAIRNKDMITEATGRLSQAQERAKGIVAGLAAGTNASMLNMKAAAINFSTDTILALDAAKHHLIQWEEAAKEGEAPILLSTQKLVEEFRELNRLMDIGAKAGLQDMGRESMHAGVSQGDSNFINKQQLEKESADRKKATEDAARKAKTDKEILNSLQETGNRLAAEDLRTLDASTLALKKKRDEAEAGAKLDEEYHKIDAELAKANTPENVAAAQAARAAAYKAYTDRLLQITRDTNAAQITEDAATKAALEAAQKKALEDLKKDLAERSLIQGKLSRSETSDALDAFGSKGTNEAGAVAKYKLEVHWDEPGSAGAMAGLKQFLASTESSFVQWKGFTTQILGGLEGSFAKFFESLGQRGQTLEQKLKGLFSSIANDGIGALSKMLAQQLINWGVDKAKAAWEETASARKIAGILADSAATDASTANQVAADATTTASATTATAANEGKMVSGALSAYAGIPWVGVALAAAAVVAMMAIMHSATGRQVGGLVGQNGPELTMLGERGLEVVAPEHDFKDWANANQNLGANIGAHQARISSLQTQAGSYGSQGLAQSGGSMPSGVTIDARGAIFASTTEGRRAIDQMVNSSNQRIGRSSG